MILVINQLNAQIILL